MQPGVQSQSGGNSAERVCFGPFELDLRGGELRKKGRRIRLQDQPFQILRMLLECPGEVILREDIRMRLWPDNTVVEFDHSINTAVKRLRDALCDSADQPRYVETVARRGYRFVGQMQTRAVQPDIVGPLETGTSPAAPNEPTTAIAGQPRSQLRPWIFALSLAAVAATIWVGAEVGRSKTESAGHIQPVTRLDFDVSGEMPPGSEPGDHAILSPDGSRLVFISRSRLLSRRLDQATVTELPGTENARSPFFSPDGRFVGFFSGETLKKVAVDGGGATALAACPLGNGGSWGEDGSIIAGCNFALATVPAEGGTPTPITQLSSGEIVHRWPQLLPGGNAVIFTSYPSVTGLEGATIQILSLRSGRRKTLLRGGTWGRYLTTGHLVYIDKGTLFALPFDAERLEVHGNPTPVLQEVAYSNSWGSAQVDISRNGTLVYRSSKAGEGLVTVQWLDEAGNTEPLLPVPANYLSPTLSPDATRLALTSAGDIWVYELSRGRMIRLTYGGGYTTPLWTADGRYVLFRAGRGILWCRADGTDQPRILTQSINQQTPWSFTPDGKQLAFVEIDPATGADIWTVPVEAGPSGLQAGKPEVFLRTPYHERGPTFSPDGRWIAYMSNESGDYNIYVQGFRNKTARYQVSSGRGGYPAWSRKGNDLFYWQLGVHSQLIAVSYRSHDNTFVTDPPRVWSTKIAGIGTTKGYDPAPDGKRIVALTPADNPGERHDRLTFLLNFFSELGAPITNEKQ
jgi:DNA-binding winged helix-turn-helix (wHTH) protein/Tol biopolymer transport system component